ncbi:MAG TPA: hypothetical protein VFF73_11875, partial [Planctomycetota bacterium]|nr:hypothetical protein [Planctomycetota bacterium]
ASEVGVVLKPRSRLEDWVATLGAIPDEPLNAILALLAREARAIPASYVPEDLAFEDLLDAVVAWLEAPNARTRGAAEALELKLDDALALRERVRTETRTGRGLVPEFAPGEVRAQGARALARACLHGARAEDRLLRAVRGALEAHVTRDGLRALISRELLRWALGQ